MFFALMVDTSGPPAPPPRGAAVDILQLSGSRSQTSDNAS
jgi:hypothetical protein